MSNVTFSYQNALPFIREEEIAKIKRHVMLGRDELVDRVGAGNDFLGWIDLPVDYDKEEFDRVKKAAKKKFRKIQKYW